ncbi:MAG TPA: hypothetical protein VFT58_03315, partial [Nitrososphaera sp.]|nr:hypothetical protein [Nitrososphaera sp.]
MVELFRKVFNKASPCLDRTHNSRIYTEYLQQVFAPSFCATQPPDAGQSWFRHVDLHAVEGNVTLA